MNKYSYFIALLATAFFSCEPDDICLAETPGTPNLIVVFYDETNPEVKKSVTDLQVKGVDTEGIVHTGTADSIAIPLKTKLPSTSFVFTTTINNTSSSDMITLNYDTQDVFISRACGYKTTFTNLTSELSNSAIWMKKIEIVNNSISESKITHVKILH